MFKFGRFSNKRYKIFGYSASIRLNNTNIPGLILDVDGVILSGRQVLPKSKQAFDLLYDKKKERFKLPVVFLTNYGNGLKEDRALHLSKKLQYNIHADQVIMSHTPLSTLNSKYGQNFTLIDGQGPITKIAKRIGFNNTITVDKIDSLFPTLDSMGVIKPDPESKNKDPAKRLLPKQIPKIEQIILFGTPKRWEKSIQIIVDCLITNGDFWQTKSHLEINKDDTDILIFAANKDLESPIGPGPRMNHGVFLNFLESNYEKTTKKRIKYTQISGKPEIISFQYAEKLLREMSLTEYNKELKNVYCIGDSIASDIYGANLYNEQSILDFYSLLVCSGNYNLPLEMNPDTFNFKKRNTEQLIKLKNFKLQMHNIHRHYNVAFKNDKKLLKPKWILTDIYESINFILHRESDSLKQE